MLALGALGNVDDVNSALAAVCVNGYVPIHVHLCTYMHTCSGWTKSCTSFEEALRYLRRKTFFTVVTLRRNMHGAKLRSNAKGNLGLAQQSRHTCGATFHVYRSVHIYICVFVNIADTLRYTRTSSCVHLHTHVYIYTLAYRHMSMPVSMSMCMCMSTSAYMYMFMYMYVMHTKHVDVYVHVHVHADVT